MNLRHILSLLILFAGSTCLSAQEINEDFIKKHLATNVYPIDKDASAIILYEKANVEITLVHDTYEKHYRVYRLIKILKQSAFEEGDLKIPYRNSKERPSYLVKIEGATYNILNNAVVATPLEKKATYSRTINDYYSELAFAMPAVKEGCVIEYTYTINSEMSMTMPEWSFQNEHPTLHSEYELVYPFRYAFTSITQGMLNFRDYPSRKVAIKEDVASYKVSTTVYDQKSGSVLWGRKNIPAIKWEPFVSSLGDHIERLDIQLSSYTNSNTVTGVEKTSDTWKRFTTTFLDWDEFGKPLNEKKTYLNATVDSVTKNKSTELEKAKAIFSYMRSDFECYDTIALTPETNLKTVFTNKKGNAAALNFLLISMLQKSGLDASAVVLSTVGNLKADNIYPLLDRYNHTVCLVKIKGTRHFLDAGSKYNPFGILPLYCYNGYARVINDDGGDSVTLKPAYVKERHVRKMTISNITDTSFDIEVMETLGIFNSKSNRQWLKENKNNLSVFKEDLTNSSSLENTDLTAFNIEFIDNADTNLIIKYSQHHSFNKPASTVYLQTDYLKYFEVSPFISMTRRLPIELPHQMDYIYSLTLKLPDNFVPDGLPEPAIITFEKDQLSFKHMIGYDKDIQLLTVTSRFTTNNTVFPVESYDVIRQFFEKMIYETNQIITLKKS